MMKTYRQEQKWSARDLSTVEAEALSAQTSENEQWWSGNARDGW